MGIYIDAADLLDDDDWKRMRRKAMDDLLNERGPVSRNFIGDLIDARSALLGNRPSAALLLIERALAELRQ